MDIYLCTCIINTSSYMYIYLFYFISVARDIKLTDDSFSSTDFELVHGLMSVSWDRIPK